MICDQAIELLPWYLNDTLESGERAAVRQHLATCESCRTALAETGQAWRVFAQHVPAADMVALAWGESPSGIDPAAAEEHLASCAECAAELELARMSRRLEEEGNVAVFPGARKISRPQATPDRSQGLGGWRAAAIAASLAAVVAASGWFQTARQPQQAAVRPVAPPVASQPATAPSPAPATGSADRELAALRQKVKDLGDMADGLQSQVRKGQEQVARLTAEPALSPYISPTDVVRGKEDNSDVAIVPAQASIALLPLRAIHAETGAHQHHEVVILSAGGTALKTLPVRRDPNGSYLLALLQGELKPGDYTLQVYGTAGGKRDPEPDGTYRIRIQ